MQPVTLEKDTRFGDVVLPAGTEIINRYTLDHPWIMFKTYRGTIVSLPEDGQPHRWPGLNNAVKEGRYTMEEAFPWLSHPFYAPQYAGLEIA